MLEQVYYFKAIRDSHRFRKNQKVWISSHTSSSFKIYHKWRGRGRYVIGDISKMDSSIGELKQIEVEKEFFEKIKRPYWTAWRIKKLKKMFPNG